jgi:predicted transcriptional regulator
MRTLTVKTGTENDFFKHGRRLAGLADRGAPLPEDSVVSFEDPADMLRLQTAARLTLFRAVKDAPGSITALSQRLRRDRNAVKRDVDALAQVGLLRVETRIMPRHGRIKEVSVAVSQFKLLAHID